MSEKELKELKKKKEKELKEMNKKRLEKEAQENAMHANNRIGRSAK